MIIILRRHVHYHLLLTLLLLLWRESRQVGRAFKDKVVWQNKVDLPRRPIRPGMRTLWKKIDAILIFVDKKTNPSQIFTHIIVFLTVEAVKGVGIVDGGLEAGPGTLGDGLGGLGHAPEPFWGRRLTSICQLGRHYAAQLTKWKWNIINKYTFSKSILKCLLKI